MNRAPVLVVMSLAHFLVMVDATIVNVALPSVQRGLGFDAGGLTWVVNAYSFAFGGCLLVGGWAADRLGPARVFVAGMAVFAAGSVVCGLAGTAETLVAGRVVQGVGGAFVCPAALAAITVAFPGPGERARALAGWSAAGAAALALGPVVGGLLTAVWSWPAVFLVPVPLCAFAALAAWRFVPRALVARRSLAGFPYRRVATANVVLALASAAMVVTCYTGTLWLQDALGYGPVATGLAFLPLSLGILLGAAVAPHALRHAGPAEVAVGGLGIAAVGLVLLTALPTEVSVWRVLPALTVLAVGFGLQSVPVCALATTVPGDQGVAAAVYQTAGQLGGAMGLVALAGVASEVDSWRGWAFAGGALALVVAVGALLGARSHVGQAEKVAAEVRK